MDNVGNSFGDETLTLFFLVTAMLLYRTVDLLAARKKLDQLAARVKWWDGSPSFLVLRKAFKLWNHNAREVVPSLRVLMLIRKEFLPGLMGIYLFLFAMLGYSTLLFDDVRSGKKASFIVAIATAIVSFTSSIVNYIIEKVKVHI